MIQPREEFIQPTTFHLGSEDDNHTQYSWQKITVDLLQLLGRDYALSAEVVVRCQQQSKHLLRSTTTAHAAANVVKLTTNS